MARKRITQIFPFLLPIRQKQRKIFFYSKMYFDKHKYSKTVEPSRLPYEIYETKSLMLNRKSGYEMIYQHNKVHNLKLASKMVDGIVINPGETFSFWQLVRFADKYTPYKDGLTLSYGKISGSYGGGLCQLSNVLFWMFLHTPLTIVERHSHAIENFEPTTEEFPHGIDATISEGWLDLKVKNNTNEKYQIKIFFDEFYMYGQILSNQPPIHTYEVFNRSVEYFRKADKIFQTSSLYQQKKELGTNKTEEYFLYNNTCEIGYSLPDNIQLI